LVLSPILLGAILLGGCVNQPSATPISTPSPTPSPSLPSSAPSGPTPSVVPTPTPEPPLSLDLPPGADAREVGVRVEPDVVAEGDGRIVVTVQNRSGERIDELVLRWPTPLRQTLSLAPFERSQQRIADGGPPLWQEWTKWVSGPGELGEPAGTISLGWGPLLANGTLTIPIIVTRRAVGDVSFDLQLLAGEAILTLDDGEPAELRVSVP
jgi:hypothetical protein